VDKSEESVARNQGVDVAGPGIDAARQVHDPREALCREEARDLGAAHPVMADDDDLRVTRKLVDPARNLAHGNGDRARERGHGQLLGLANVQHEGGGRPAQSLGQLGCAHLRRHPAELTAGEALDKGHTLRIVVGAMSEGELATAAAPVPHGASGSPTRPRVVVVGGGFGGLTAVRGLAGADVDVTLVDRRNHHLFQPLLYQVASAALNPSDIASPIRTILRSQRNATVLLGEVTSVDLAARSVVLADGDPLAYDFLILAAGARDSYFGHPEWEQHAPGLKSLEQAEEIRNRVLFAFEAAEREPDPVRRAAWLTFVVVGGGPTGVELAGALAEIAFHTLCRDFRRIDLREAEVILLEGGDRVLPSFSVRSSASARRQLERLGVRVRAGSIVTAMDAEAVWLGAERIAARTKIWAAGVQASSLTGSLGVPIDRSGRIHVAPDLSLPGNPEAFAIGDLCATTADGKPVPGVAPAATQEGRCAAANVRRLIDGRPTEPFRYVDKGSLATIGRRAAVAEMLGLHLSGFVAWLAWLGIHVLFLIGFRNRILVMFEWAWAYLTYQRAGRIILRPPPGREPGQTSSSATPIARSMMS
jgi:NADH:quinone reductase (non-electrogenic)